MRKHGSSCHWPRQACCGGARLGGMDSSPAKLPPVDLSGAVLMWRDYVESAGREELRPDLLPVVEYFGDSPALADALLREVTHGDKRATSSLESEYLEAGEPLPEVGSHWIACDSSGSPILILRTTKVSLAAFEEVDADFAYAEGEDDRSLESWRREHEKYWRRTQRAAGLEWNPELSRQPGCRIVLERFEIVWPREPAGQRVAPRPPVIQQPRDAM